MGGLRVLLWFAVSAGVMRWLSPRLLLAPLAVPAMLLVPVAALLAVLTAEEHSHPLDSVGLLAWPLTGVVVYRLLASRDPDDEPPWFCYLHAAALWLMTAMLTWEAGHQVHSLVGAAGAWRLAAVGLVPAASVALVLRLADRGVSLPGAYPRWYRGLGLGPIAAALGCWVLFACVAHDGNPWPLAYVPVLNPLDTAIGLVLLVLLKWLRCFESLTAEEDGGRRHPRYAWQVVGLLAFLWLNAILARAAHFWGGVPYRMDDLLRSAGYQATLALCWGALGIAFMVAGTRRARRTLWMTGAGLMTLVVLKLLVFDLSNSGTVARIVSFMAIGGLLLLVGYLAPVPPRTEPGDEPPDERKRHAEDAA